MTSDSENQQNQGRYGASDITVLEGLEAVRKRPGMYIGSTGERGLHHLVYEVVDNSVDEALAGYCSHIQITLQNDGGVRVEDDGRGIPVDMHPTEGKPTVEVVMTVLHAGGKFGGGGYAVSGGLHGVGISVVNALSTRVDTTVHRQGYEWNISFAEGGRVTQELSRGAATEATGTTQVFYPDPGIFESTDFDFESAPVQIISVPASRCAMTAGSTRTWSSAMRSPKSPTLRAANLRSRRAARSSTSTTTACWTTSTI